MKNLITLTITVETDRTTHDTIELFRKFLLYYHPSLKAVVSEGKPVAAPIPEKQDEDLL